MRTGRTGDRQSPFRVVRTKARQTDWEPIRELHQGQRSHAPRQQAGHMTAPDQLAKQSSNLLPAGGVHIGPKTRCPTSVATRCSIRFGSRRSIKQSAKRSTNPIARSVAPRSSAPASDVIAPPSNPATTLRPSTGANSKNSGLHSVGIGARRESAVSLCSNKHFR